jgi:hypothetical protein
VIEPIRLSTNQPAWSRAWFSTVLAEKINHIRAMTSAAGQPGEDRRCLQTPTRQAKQSIIYSLEPSSQQNSLPGQINVQAGLRAITRLSPVSTFATTPPRLRSAILWAETDCLRGAGWRARIKKGHQPEEDLLRMVPLLLNHHRHTAALKISLETALATGKAQKHHSGRHLQSLLRTTFDCTPMQLMRRLQILLCRELNIWVPPREGRSAPHGAPP